MAPTFKVTDRDYASSGPVLTISFPGESPPGDEVQLPCTSADLDQYETGKLYLLGTTLAPDDAQPAADAATDVSGDATQAGGAGTAQGGSA